MKKLIVLSEDVIEDIYIKKDERKKGFHAFIIDLNIKEIKFQDVHLYLFLTTPDKHRGVSFDLSCRYKEEGIVFKEARISKALKCLKEGTIDIVLKVQCYCEEIDVLNEEIEFEF